MKKHIRPLFIGLGLLLGACGGQQPAASSSSGLCVSRTGELSDAWAYFEVDPSTPSGEIAVSTDTDVLHISVEGQVGTDCVQAYFNEAFILASGSLASNLDGTRYVLETLDRTHQVHNWSFANGAAHWGPNQMGATISAPIPHKTILALRMDTTAFVLDGRELQFNLGSYFYIAGGVRHEGTPINKNGGLLKLPTN